MGQRLVKVNVLAAITVVCIAVITTVSIASTLTEGPVSVSALVGENALFHCNGSGNIVLWIVDGLNENELSIKNLGISSTSAVSISSGTVQSTLTIPATSVNNGTTVQCVLYPGEVTSNNATLTVLSGIGQVTNVRFTFSFNNVVWDPPATAGVLSGLYYIVIVMNNNTGQVIVSATTTNTNYPLPDDTIKLCQYYTANVTAFSSEHHSDSVVTGLRTEGENYDLSSVSETIVVSYNTSYCAITFIMNIQQHGALVCPDQQLLIKIRLTKDGILFYEEAIAQPGVIKYKVYVRKSCHCVADIMIVADDREIEMKTVLFSSYNVQDCDVSTDHTSILVECTFAINSTAPGIVVIQDDQSQYTINKTLQRLQQDSDKGSVNITGLPAGEYSVRVYDNNIISPATDTAAAAYEHSQLLHIMGPQPSPTLSHSAVVLSDTSVVESISKHTTVVSPTITHGPITAVSTTVTISTISAAFIIIIMMIISVILCVSLRSCKHKNANLVPIETVYQQASDNSEEHNMTMLSFVPNEAVVPTTTPTIASDSTTVVIHDSTCMEARSEYLPTTQEPTVPTVGASNVKSKEPVYADLRHSTNPPAPPLPAELVPATVKKQTDSTVTTQPAAEDKLIKSQVQELQVQHSTTGRSVPTLPAEHTPVQYATIAPVLTPPVNEPDLQQSTNPPAPPLPADDLEPALPKTQTDNTVTTQSEDKDQVDGDPKHSTNPPAPPLPTEPTVNKTQTDNTVTTQSEAEDKGSAAPPPAELNPGDHATDETFNYPSSVTAVQEQRSRYAGPRHSTNPPTPPLPLPVRAPPQCEPLKSSELKQPQSCEGSTSGYHSASAPIVGVSGVPAIPGDEAVYLPPPTTDRTHYSKLATDTVLLPSKQPSLQDSSGQRSDYQQSEECDDSKLENQPVIPSPVSTYTPSVTETRGGVELAGEDSNGVSVQHFPYLQDNSDEALKTSPSEHTAPGMRICSGMKQEITAIGLVNRNNGEVVVEITIRPNDHECHHRSEHSLMCEAPSLSAVPASNHDSTSVTNVGPAPPTDSVVQDEQPKEPDLQHSCTTDQPISPLSAELVPVQYATVKKQTDSTVTTQSTEDNVMVPQQGPYCADSATNPAEPHCANMQISSLPTEQTPLVNSQLFASYAVYEYENKNLRRRIILSELASFGF